MTIESVDATRITPGERVTMLLGSDAFLVPCIHGTKMSVLVARMADLNIQANLQSLQKVPSGFG
jgi:hypothetical protein